MLRSLAVLIGLFVCVTTGYAEQLSFNKSSINGTTSFYYKWKDANSTLHELKFKLPTKQLRKDKNSFKPFDNKNSNDYVYKKMKEYTEKNNSNLSNIRIKRVRTGFEMEAKGLSKTVIKNSIAELKVVSKSAMSEYVALNNYKYMDEKTIRPDHTKIAKKYISPMRPVAQAISTVVNSKNPRDVVNYALSFVQAIPYNILKSRYSSNGAGFRVPYGLLMGNKGDCDTKSVALASILRNFYPRLRMIMIYIPEHAFVGFAFPPKKGDAYLTIDGTQFVLSEPVGPNQSYLGKIAARSLSKLQQSDFTYDEIPF